MLKIIMLKSAPYFTIFCILVLLSLSSLNFVVPTEAYGGSRSRSKSNANGNITVKWDTVQWTADGYISLVTIYNFQPSRRVEAPGWRLGWTWSKKEVIWNLVGAKTTTLTRQGDCSRFKGNDIPLSCSKNPTIMDLTRNAPYNQRIANCCRGGVLSSWFHYRPNSISSFQISVGSAGTTNRTVQLPQNITFLGPRDVYRCGPSKIIRPTVYITADGRRTTQALMTWDVTCLYSGHTKP